MSEWERDAQYRPGDVVNGYVLAADGSWKPIGSPAPQQPVEPRNGLAIASVICGIVGMLSGLVPLFWWFAAALGVTALVLGLAGRGGYVEASRRMELSPGQASLPAAWRSCSQSGER